MRITLYFITFIVIISLFIMGCSNATEDEVQNIEGQKIEVQKRVGDENKYEVFKDITYYEDVEKVKEILDMIDWENAKVEMVRPPDYRFSFPTLEAKGLAYSLWISSNATVEIIIYEEHKYSQLDEIMSTELIEILTRE
ncbi:MAG: hypothetical protein ABS934_14505 [Psychrobacillus sp.]